MRPNHNRRNSGKQHERKFDRKGVTQLGRVVTEELTGMHAHLDAQKMLIEAIIRVLGIDAKVVAQLKRDAKAREREEAEAGDIEVERAGNHLDAIGGEIGGPKRLPWWRRVLARIFSNGAERACLDGSGSDMADASAGALNGDDERGPGQVVSAPTSPARLADPIAEAMQTDDTLLELPPGKTTWSPEAIDDVALARGPRPVCTCGSEAPGRCRCGVVTEAGAA